MRYHARMKAKKEKAVKQLFSTEENEEIPIHSPFKQNIQKLAPHLLLDADLFWYENY